MEAIPNHEQMLFYWEDKLTKIRFFILGRVVLGNTFDSTLAITAGNDITYGGYMGNFEF